MPGRSLPANPKLAAVRAVEIGEGVFKYILCKVYEGANIEDSKFIVRGDPDAEYHSDVYDKLDSKLEGDGINCECVGGGKINHEPDKKAIRVYGKSQGYGKADHSLAAKLIKEAFPEYENVTWTND